MLVSTGGFVGSARFERLVGDGELLDLDPAACRPLFPDTSLAVADEAVSRALAAEIDAGGQVEPVLVRRPRDGDRRYALLDGLQRWRAVSVLHDAGARELRLRARAVDVDDEEAFAIFASLHRDAPQTATFAWAIACADAVERLYAHDYGGMAHRIGLLPSDLRAIINVGRLPETIRRAIGAVDLLRIDEVATLLPELRYRQKRESIMTIAKEVAAEQQRRAAAGEPPIPPHAVLADLMVRSTRGQRHRRDFAIRTPGGAVVVQVSKRGLRTGHIEVSDPPGTSREELRHALLTAIDHFVGE